MATILLVEDYPVIREIYTHALKQAGHTVEVCVDGEEALRKLKDNTYDLILLDILLPKVDGIEILERLHDEYEGKTMPKVVVLSDFDRPKLIDKAVKLGALEYMMKVEHTPSQVAERVGEILSAK